MSSMVGQSGTSAVSGTCPGICTLTVTTHRSVRGLAISFQLMWLNSFIRPHSIQGCFTLKMSMWGCVFENWAYILSRTVASITGKWPTVCVDIAASSPCIRSLQKKCTESGMTCQARNISDVRTFTDVNTVLFFFKKWGLGVGVLLVSPGEMNRCRGFVKSFLLSSPNFFRGLPIYKCWALVIETIHELKGPDFSLRS